MVGTSAACAFGSSAKLSHNNIIVLETAPEQPDKDWNAEPFENRVSSITPGSQRFLDSMGVWEKIVSRRHNPYKDMYVWDGLSSGNIYLNSADLNHPSMAYMVENTVIVESCMERARELNTNIQMQFNAKIKDVQLPSTSSELATVHLDDGDVIRTKLVVGADGPNSYIRSKVARIETADYDYKQWAVVATLQMKCPGNVNTTAWQRFLPTGPIALLPMSEEVSSLVWSTTKEQAMQLVKENTEEEFVGRINDAISNDNSHDTVVGAVNDTISKLLSVVQPGLLTSRYISHLPSVRGVQEKSRAMFPLQLKHSPQYVKTRMALIGDAAHRIHPMAGLGVNLGFGDAERLLHSLEASADIGNDHGCLEELLSYETDRQRHVVAVVGATTGLHHLYSTSATPLVLLRTLGLHATNNFNPVKEQIIKYAMQ